MDGNSHRMQIITFYVALEKLLFDLPAAVLMEGSHANRERGSKMSGGSARKPEP